MQEFKFYGKETVNFKLTLALFLGSLQKGRESLGVRLNLCSPIHTCNSLDAGAKE